MAAAGWTRAADPSVHNEGLPSAQHFTLAGYEIDRVHDVLAEFKQHGSN